MSLPLRRLFFYLILIIFIISAPLVILYTAGFRYNFKQNKVLRTGAIILSSNPTGAAVFLNNRQRRETTPARLLNVTPGEYNVSLAKDGFYSWQKRLAAESNQVTFGNNVILFKKSEPVEISSGEIVDFILDPRGKTLFFIKKDGNLYEIWRQEANGETILTWRSTFTQTPKLLEWLADDALLIKSEEYYLLNIKTNAQTIKSIDKITGRPWEKIGVVKNHNFLLGLSGNDLYSINPLSGTTDLLEHQVTDFYPYGNKFIFLQKNEKGEASLKESEWTSVREIVRLPSVDFEFREAPPPWLALYDRTNKKMVLLSENDGSKQYTINGDGLCWLNADAPALLSRSSFEIWNNLPKNNPGDLITRVSEEITNMFCHPSRNAFIIATNNSIKALELDTRDQQNIYLLTKIEKIRETIMDKDGANIYFTGTKNQGQGLWRLQIK
ncbi:MAG: PEGA domain-containing protein [bacterium]|nr:PEGA domain-containing protein [bacterium]